MKFLDTLLLSIKNLWRHKLRSILTILGVMIGTCAIVIMLSLGLAMDRNFLAQLNQMGNIMQIQVYNYNEGGKTSEGKDIPTLDDNMISEFTKIEGVQGATPILNISLKMGADKYYGWANVMGIKTDMFSMLDIPIGEGRGLQEGDTDQMVVGGYVAQQLYNPKSRRWDPAPEGFNLMEEKVTLSWDMSYGESSSGGNTGSGSKKKVKPVNVDVVGVMTQSGGNYDWSVIMPIETVKKYQKEMEKYNKQNGGSSGGGVRISYSSSYSPSNSSGTQTGYNQAIVKVKSIDDVVSVMEQIQTYGYNTYSPVQMLEDMKAQYAGLRQILGGIGVMAFIIAAIGIANTMYMSIYERTREIGIIKVIGARLGDIRRLFMLEAGWIGIFGGVCGVLLSFLASYLLNRFNVSVGGSVIWTPEGEQKLDSSYIPFWLALAAFTFSTFASLLAGLMPSTRAMRLSVMKALRQD